MFKKDAGFYHEPGDNIIKVDYSNDWGSIDLSFGKTKKRLPFEKNIRMGAAQVKIFSCYISGTEQYIKEIKKALKGQSDNYTISETDKTQFIKRTAIYACSFLDDYKIDVVSSVQSSGRLPVQFAKEIADRLPGATYYPESAFKTTKLIRVDVANPNITLQIAKTLQNQIDKMGENFQINKIPNPWRKFVKDYMGVSEDIRKMVTGNTVLIIDDFLTSGETISQVALKIWDFAPKQVLGITIMK